jgi:hypothetical protein
MIAELELPLFSKPAGETPRNVEWFIGLLRGRDWILARELLVEAGQPVTDGNKRFLRDLANQSGGRIGSGQKGYKLVEEMTAEEFAHVKDHVRIGLEILHPLSHLGESLHFIRDHHEHWDGSGYPFGRAAFDITIGGRVLTAADAFDALTSKRAYRDPMSAVATLDFLQTQAGALLEPRVYEALRVVVTAGAVEGIPRIG